MIAKPERVDVSRPASLPFAAHARFIAIFCAFFFPVYMIGLAYGSRSNHVWHLYMGWERQIPLVEWMIIPYFSLWPSYLIPLFILTAPELNRLTRQSVIAILAAGLAFILFPTTSGFESVRTHGLLAPLFEIVRAVDRPFNMVPSLHVTGGALVLLACAQAASRPVALVLRTWLALMIASTLFVHQHHLADVAAGLLLAIAVRRLTPLRAASEPFS